MHAHHSATNVYKYNKSVTGLFLAHTRTQTVMLVTVDEVTHTHTHIHKDGVYNLVTLHARLSVTLRSLCKVGKHRS